jgi:hypothetical protein
MEFIESQRNTWKGRTGAKQSGLNRLCLLIVSSELPTVITLDKQL